MSAISTTTAASSAATAAANTATAGTRLAENFTAFLQLLTTQLRNQNPLEPLDTNQFTQQLVQFAQVEQQINMNTSLGSLISLQQSTQTAAAMSFLGANVRVEGNTAQLAAGQAAWAFSSEKPATGTFNVHDANGRLVHSENRTISVGAQNFTWSGRDAEGNQLPDGPYTVSIVAKDASGQNVAVSTQVDGVVDGVDLSVNPPLLSVNGKTFGLDKVTQVRRNG